MFKKSLVLIVIACFCIIYSENSSALDDLSDYVNDEAGVISPEYEQLLVKELQMLKKNTSVEMAVATVKSLEGIPIEEFSLKLAHGVLGEKGKDNGILLMLAVDDREYRIEVGYGLEPVINAALAGRIGRNVMAPRFKEGNYGQGFLDSVRIIVGILQNDTSPEVLGNVSLDSKSLSNTSAIVTMIFMMLLIMAVIFIMRSEKLGSSNRKGHEKLKKPSEDDKDFAAAAIIGALFGGGGRGGFGGGSSGGGFGGFGGGGFGGGGFSGRF